MSALAVTLATMLGIAIGVSLAFGFIGWFLNLPRVRCAIYGHIPGPGCYDSDQLNLGVDCQRCGR